MSAISQVQTKTDVVSLTELHNVASSLGIIIPEKDADDYLKMLNAGDAVMRHVISMPEYQDPRLNPVDAGDRKYKKLSKEENPLNAWSHRSDIQATTSGPLAGRTVVLKDNISVGHLPLTCGTFPQLISADRQFPVSKIDAPVVSRILEAGALVKGTATCENYSMCALSYSSASGPVDNAWARGYTTGGSSSGCTALVGIQKVKEYRKKLGLPDLDLGEGVDMAVGGDQGGSIRLPAAYGGVYGLKPTFGLIPYTGIASLHPMIDSCGPICSSVRDVALLLSVIAGYDGFDPRMTPESPLKKDVKPYASNLDAFIAAKKAKGEWTPTTAGKGLRVGVIKESFAIPALDPEVAATVHAAADQFQSLGATVEEVSIPMHSLSTAIWIAATRCSMADYTTRNMPPSLLSYPLPDLAPPPPTQELYDLLSVSNPAVVNTLFGTPYLKARYAPSATAKAHMHIHELRAAYDAALETYDVLVTPVNPTPAMRHPGPETSALEKLNLALGSTANTIPFNVTGHPGLSMPVGWGKVGDMGGDGMGLSKLPVAMQIVGRRFGDEEVLRAAMIWEVGGLGLDRE